MPDPLTAFFAAVGSAIGGTTGAYLIIYAPQIAAFTTAVAVSGYSINQRKKAASAARAAYNASLKDRNVTVRGTTQARELVMGKVRKGGTLAYIGSTGSSNEKLTMVVVMASHQIEAFDTIYFDENPLTLDGSGYVLTDPYRTIRKVSASATISLTAGAGSVTLPYTPLAGSAVVVFQPIGEDASVEGAGTIAGNTVSITGLGTSTGTGRVHYQHTVITPRARVRGMLGSDSQAAFADLITQFPGEWTSNHRLRGCAYLVVELDYDPDAFPSGIPNVSAVMRGTNQVYDPRTLTTGYSENPALLMRWYLLNTLGGRRVSAQLDEPSFIAAANTCDTLVDYGDGNVALYIAGLVASTEQLPRDVLDELAEAMAGRWGYSNGLIRARAGALASTGPTITADWIAPGPVSIAPTRARAELRNVIQGTFIDPAANWQQVQFPRVTDATAVTADGAELAGEVEFGAINRSGQAQQVAAVMLREDRQALVVTLTCNLRAYTLQLFDVVAVTLDRFGWSSKLFEVVGRSYSHGGGITLTLKETSSTIYAFGVSFPTIDPAPNTNLPSPWTVQTPGTVTVTSGTGALLDGTTTSRTVVSWPALTDAGVNQGGYLEVAFLDATQTTDFQIVRADTLTSHTLYGLRVGFSYVIKVRAVNGSGVRSDWSAHVVHNIDGPQAMTTYRQTTAPTGSQIQPGSLWYDTDDGSKLYRYAAGSWVAVPLGTGALDTNAATNVFVDTPTSDVTVTGNFHVPDGSNPSWNTEIATITFTPDGSGEALLTLDAVGTVSNSSGSANSVRWSIQDDNDTWDDWKRISRTVAAGASAEQFSMHTSRRFSVTAGVAQSFTAYVARFSSVNTLIVSQIEMRCELIKR
jgi:hypothetical protein